MKLLEMFKGVDIVRANMDLDINVNNVSYSTANLAEGDVFVAIKGNATNGHLFIPEAMKLGAACVVCQSVPEDNNTPYILVKNTRIALAQLSKNFFGRPDEKLKLVAITGTNGKTSTAYLVREVLLYQYGDVVGLIGTNQNLVGSKPYVATQTTPQSYDIYKLLAEMVEAGCKYAVMEVSSHALEQERVYGLHFDVGVFTNLTQDHLDFHKDMVTYAQAKAKLFTQCSYAVVNGDDPNYKQMLNKNLMRTMIFSAKSDDADLVAKNVIQKPYKVEFEALMQGAINRISVGIPGLFTVYNSLAAIGACVQLGIGLSDIAMALKTAKGVLGRYERVDVDTPYSVIIDFAHTPQGMESVLSMTKEMRSGRVIAVFGCGGDRDKTKRPIMGKIAAQYADQVVITSDNSRSERPMDIIFDILWGAKDGKAEVSVIADRKKAIAYAMSQAGEGDVILLLGKGHETYQETAGQRAPFDERQIVKANL